MVCLKHYFYSLHDQKNTKGQGQDVSIRRNQKPFAVERSSLLNLISAHLLKLVSWCVLGLLVRSDRILNCSEILLSTTIANQLLE